MSDMREWCASIADAEEQSCRETRDAYPRDAYHWAFWEHARKTAAVIAGTIRSQSRLSPASAQQSDAGEP